MTAPDILTSTRGERLAFAQDQWQCLDHFWRVYPELVEGSKSSPSCGKCHILKGRDAEELYAEYIEGMRSYIEITKEIRK